MSGGWKTLKKKNGRLKKNYFVLLLIIFQNIPPPPQKKRQIHDSIVDLKLSKRPFKNYVFAIFGQTPLPYPHVSVLWNFLTPLLSTPWIFLPSPRLPTRIRTRVSVFPYFQDPLSPFPGYVVFEKPLRDHFNMTSSAFRPFCNHHPPKSSCHH